MGNNLPNTINGHTPEWFLGEMEDILDLLRRSDTQKQNSIVGMQEISYILSLPQRLFQCGHISAQEKNEFQKYMNKFHAENVHTRDFLLRLVYYIYSTGLLKHAEHEFKQTRDTLLEVARIEKRTKEVVVSIMSISNKYFPDLSPGETLGKNGEVIDLVYRNLEDVSNTLIALLYAEGTNLLLHLPEVYKFYDELLSLSYIDSQVYQDLVASEGRSCAASVSIGFLYAIRGGFFDNDPDFKIVFLQLLREYLMDCREFEIVSSYIDSTTR